MSPTTRCFLPPATEKLSEHGVSNVLTLVLVTMETCEWIPCFSWLKGICPHGKKKIKKIVRLKSLFASEKLIIHAYNDTFTLKNTHKKQTFSSRGNPFHRATHAVLSRPHTMFTFVMTHAGSYSVVVSNKRTTNTPQ